MYKSGSIDLPLHYGRAPRWLFERMRNLARCICEYIVAEFGSDFFLERISDPFWFQCFGCVLGFDWHSSGLTTTVCGAIKEAFRDLRGCGIYVCGGKGSTSRKTPQEIRNLGNQLSKNTDSLVSASRLAAKVDNCALQDGFNLYHHTFVFTDKLKWAVIQQGMDTSSRWARRYHWYCPDSVDFTNEPHRGIVSEKSFITMNMVDGEKEKLRRIVAELSCRRPEENVKDLFLLKQSINKLPLRHKVFLSDVNPCFLDKIFLKTYEKKPENFTSLLETEGIGPKTIRALALISDLIYGEKISFRDPARFSFAHGGKDGYPYKINLSDYERTINMMRKILSKARVERSYRIKALKSLYRFYYDRKTGSW